MSDRNRNNYQRGRSSDRGSGHGSGRGSFEKRNDSKIKRKEDFKKELSNRKESSFFIKKP